MPAHPPVEEPPESWLVGVAASGDALASLRVHGGYVAAGPASRRPVRAHVRLRLRRPTPSGFPDAEEAAELQQAEDRLVGALDGPVLVAVVGAPGFRDLVVHADDEASVEAAVDRADLAACGYEPEVDLDDDPAWSTYRALFGQAVAADYDRRMVARLASAGADLDEPRRVRHLLRFSGHEDAAAVVEALHGAGIDAELVAGDDEPGGVAAGAMAAVLADDRATGRATVVVSEVAVVSQPGAARSRAGLSDLAGSWGGSYAGWTSDL